MMKLESTLIRISEAGRRKAFPVSSVAMTAVTLLYLVAVLSVPLSRPQTLVWLAVYPVAVSEMCGIGFGRLFLKSLWVLPLVLLIAAFNPILDTGVAFHVYGIAVSRGWVSFTCILLRGLLSMQAVLILIGTAGFYDVCASMRRMGCPRILVTQILLTYRYMSVLLEEALGMHRARQARGFGRRSYPLRQWATLCGQLLIRSYERASRIYRAMLARGFDGTLPAQGSLRMDLPSWTFAAICVLAFLFIRLFC